MTGTSGTASSPSALLLDLDGTLVNTPEANRAGIAAAAGEALSRAGIPAAEWRAANAQAFTFVWATAEQAWLGGQASSEDVSAGVYQHTLLSVGADLSLVPHLVRAHQRALSDALAAYDDVPSVLSAASANGVRLAVITNGPSILQRHTLAATGLAHRLDAIIIAAELGVSKPDKRIFDAALAAIGTRPDRAWHVGDSLTHDVAGAQAAGIRAIWINRDRRPIPDGAPQPDQIINSFTELFP